jgi:hypothetical protein
MNISFEYLKSQPTVGALRKVTREAQSPIKFSKGDKFVARTGNKHQQVSSEGFCESSFTPSPHSLMPRTLNYSKLNQARTNLNVQSAFKDLGIEML